MGQYLKRPRTEDHIFYSEKFAMKLSGKECPSSLGFKSTSVLHWIGSQCRHLKSGDVLGLPPLNWEIPGGLG